MSRLPLVLTAARKLAWIRKVRGGLKLALAVVPRFAGREFVVENDGVRLTCDLTSYLEWNNAALAGYEVDEKRLFVALFPPSRRSVLLDVGANIGSHSLSFAQAFARVVAFDPNPVTFRRLLANLALNPDAKVEPHNVGLGEAAATLSFYQPADDFENQGSGTFDPAFAPGRYAIVELPVVRGDDFVGTSGLTRIDGIKIDVQGFEPQVLKGLRETIARDRPLIWLEISHATLAQIAASGGIAALIPQHYGLRKFVTSQKWGLIHRMAITTMQNLEPIEEGDFLLVPDEWP